MARISNWLSSFFGGNQHPQQRLVIRVGPEPLQFEPPIPNWNRVRPNSIFDILIDPQTPPGIREDIMQTFRTPAVYIRGAEQDPMGSSHELWYYCGGFCVILDVGLCVVFRGDAEVLPYVENVKTGLKDWLKLAANVVKEETVDVIRRRIQQM